MLSGKVKLLFWMDALEILQHRRRHILVQWLWSNWRNTKRLRRIISQSLVGFFSIPNSNISVTICYRFISEAGWRYYVVVKLPVKLPFSIMHILEIFQITVTNIARDIVQREIRASRGARSSRRLSGSRTIVGSSRLLVQVHILFVFIFRISICTGLSKPPMVGKAGEQGGNRAQGYCARIMHSTRHTRA